MSAILAAPVLDVFCHCLPAAFCRAVERLSERPLAMYRRACAIRVMVDLDARRRLMDQFPGYQQILSLVSPTVEAHAGPDQAWELARVGNDAMAEMVTREPERFPAFIASLPMNHPDGAIAEAERALRQLGSAGFKSTQMSPVYRWTRNPFLASSSTSHLWADRSGCIPFVP